MLGMRRAWRDARWRLVGEDGAATDAQSGERGLANEDDALGSLGPEVIEGAVEREGNACHGGLSIVLSASAVR